MGKYIKSKVSFGNVSGILKNQKKEYGYSRVGNNFVPIYSYF